MNNRRISIVVPVYNEEESLPGLMREIHQVATHHMLDLDVVFVDDGSRDRSWEVIAELAAAHGNVGGIRFRRNAGKAAALMAGFAAARGDVVVTMDADLQDPPQELPRLLNKLDEGYDLVSGWKQVRHDPWHKVYPSRVFNAMISGLTQVRLHDHVCGLKCYRREVVKRMRIYGEFHRFLGVFAAADGFRVTEIPTLHRPRVAGVGKYGFSRFAKGFLDMITVWFLTRYRWRPQHVIGVAGILIAAGLIVLPLIGWIPWLGWPFLGLLFLLVSSLPAVVLIAIGLVAELQVRNLPLDHLYEVMERVGWCAGEDTLQPNG